MANLFERLEYAAQVVLWYPNATVLNVETKPRSPEIVSPLSTQP